MHEVALVAPFARVLVVAPADGVAEVGDVGQVAVERPLVVPPGVEVVHGALGLVGALVVQVDVALEVVVAVFAHHHGSYGAEAAGLDVHVLVELLEPHLVYPAGRDVQHVVEHDGVRADRTDVFLGTLVTMATRAYLTVEVAAGC